MSLTVAEIQALPSTSNPRVILASDKARRPYFIEADTPGADATTGDAVFESDFQTLRNKTLGEGTQINLGTGNFQGDLYYQGPSGGLERIPIGPEGSVLVSISGNPTWGSVVPEDSQAFRYIVRGSTSGATQAILTTDGLAASLSNIPQLPENSMISIKGHIVARSSSGAYMAKKFIAAVKRDIPSASIALVGTPTFTDAVGSGGGAAFWGTEFITDMANTGFSIRVTGEIGITIRWVAVIETVEVTW